MAGLSEQSIDPKRTVVVLNFPSNVGEDELTIHFQKERNGGGDVDDVVLDGSVAFVTFDMPQVAASVLNHPEQVINGSSIDVQSYESWLANKKKQEGISAMDNQEDAANVVTTIYVSDIKDSTTEDSITLFFENKKRSGGGDLCEDKERYKRLSATVARLTFVSSKDAQNVLKKANETPLKLEGNLLKVSTVFEQTHDRSILLAKNVNPQTNEETFRNFVEIKKKADVMNVVFGKDGKAIVILKSEIDEDYANEGSSKEDMKLDGSIISLEFAPLTKGIRISNIPPETSSDDIRFKFSNPKSGGGQVTDMMLDKRNGIANVYFEKCSVVSGLVKKEHKFKGVPLTVIPYYDDFEELREITTKTTEFSGAYSIDPLVMDYIFIKQEIENKFDFKSMKYDKETSRFHFTKEFDDPKLAQEFENKLKEFLYSFVKDEVRITKTVFGKVKEAIEKKHDEFEGEKVDFSFDGYRVTLVGKKEDVTRQKRSVEATMDRFIEESKLESTQFSIEDKNKLKFLNFIDYFKKLMTEFPGVQIHGMESSTGKLSLLGTAEKTKDVQLRILQDLMKISESEVQMSDRQIDFLKRTECQIVNDELKKDNVMLMLISLTGLVGAKSLNARIFSLKKCDDNEENRLQGIVKTKTSEKCIKVDEETASFLAKTNKLQEFKKEELEKNRVLIDQELADPCSIWIVCEESKMKNAENELASLTDEKKITSCTFKPMDPMKVRFLKEHCWDRIRGKENQKSCKAEGVAVLEIDSCSLEVKGTQAGRKEMITFLETLAENVYFKNQYRFVVNFRGRNEPEDAASTVRTIYVSGIKDSTTEDSITLFFENKKRSGGGDLCEDKEGYKRLSTTVARLTYVSSKDAQNVVTKANERPLKLEDNVLKVSTVFEPTHDRSILLAKNLNSRTKEETFRTFVEVTKSADVFNVVFGKAGKAIVILKTEIDSEVISEDTRSSEDMKLDGSVISLEFAPLTKGIRISNIPPETSSDDMRFKFSNKKIGGGPITDMMLDKKNGVANVYFEKSSVVSELVKKEHKFKDVPLTVIPYYDEFEELQAMATKTTAFSGDYHIDPRVIAYVINHGRIDEKFDLKAMKFDESSSRFHFTKEFEDSKDATEFTNKLKEFLHSFVKKEVKIPKAVFQRVKEAIEGKRDEFDADVVEFNFDGSRVIFVGKRENVAAKKQLVEAMVDTFTEEAQKNSTDFPINDKNKLKFLNFIDYFKKLETEFLGVQIHGMESSAGKLSLLGTAEKTKDVQLRILHDLMMISESEVQMSDRQIDFLKRTECQIVNDELKKDDVMLMLISLKGVVGTKSLNARIFSLKKCDDNEENLKENRLKDIVQTKTSEKCIKVDKETASFLAKSNKLQEFKREEIEKNQVLIDQELADPCNIWIVCEESKMKNAENELACLTDEKKITSCTFKPMDPMKVRFLKDHCWDRIRGKEIQKSCKAEGVAVLEIDSGSFEVKGTQAGRKEMIFFLEKLAGNVNFKAYPLTEPGMKKQISMEATNAIISQIEKNHKCGIGKYMHPEETHDKTKGDGGGSAMNLPYHSMSSVSDKEVKLASGRRITIIVGDLAQQKVDVIVNTTNHKVDLNANSCGRALLKVAGKELLSECQKIGSLKMGNIASTGPAKLNCKRVYHVRASPWDNGIGAQILRTLIKKCLAQMEKDKLRSIAIPAIGTGNLHCPHPEVTKILFEDVTDYLTAHPQSTIEDVHFVAFSGDQATVDAFLDALQEIKSVILSRTRKHVPVLLSRNEAVPNAGGATSSGPQPVDACASHSRKPAKSVGGDESISIRIYSDDREKIDKAWGELRRKICQNIRVRIINNDVIKNFTDRGLEKLHELERDNDVKIIVDKSKGMVIIKGYISDVANVREKIDKILKDIKDNESKGAHGGRGPQQVLVGSSLASTAQLVPVYWDISPTEKPFYKITLSTSSKEYKDVETAFHKTASNQIVRIERIQNKEIYQLYNVKRQAMMKKYDSNFAGKELMLFHGTCDANIEKINAGGLNRNFAGQHATSYGKGVYFARDAKYSCSRRFSPPDSHGLRYMYYAKVLVGDYTQGNSSMRVPPNKNSANTYETYDSVVNDTANPTIYVMFQDYEYYTEYLITFK